MSLQQLALVLGNYYKDLSLNIPSFSLSSRKKLKAKLLMLQDSDDSALFQKYISADLHPLHKKHHIGHSQRDWFQF